MDIIKHQHKNYKNRQKKYYLFIVCFFLIICLVKCGKNREDEEFLSGEQRDIIITDEEKNAVKEDSRVEQAIKYGDTALIVSNEEAKTGNRVIVTFYLANNPGLLGMSGTLWYDEDSLTLEKVALGEEFKDVLELNYSKEFGNGMELLWSGEEVSKDQISDGIILMLEFLIRKDSPEIRTPVTFLPDKEGVCDNNLSLINLLVENGYITILPANESENKKWQDDE